MDLIWPHISGGAEEAPTARWSVELEFLDQVERHLDTSESKQRETIRAVESKLMALLTLASVLSAVTIGSFTFVATFAKLSELPQIPTLVAALLIFYIMLQLWRALWCAVAGLTRRGYKEANLHPPPFEGIVTVNKYRVCIADRRIDSLDYNRWVINSKVNDMNVAHVAYGNALRGTLVLMLVTLVIALYRIM